MRAKSFRDRLLPGESSVYAQAIFLGFVLAESWYLAQAVALRLNSYIESTSNQLGAIAACSLTIAIGGIYLFTGSASSGIKRLSKSGRFDLLAPLLLGVLFSMAVGGVGVKKYSEYAEKLSDIQLILLALAPTVIALLILMRAAVQRQKTKAAAPFFLGDQDIQSEDEDLLGLSNSAIRFADRVFNGGSLDSLVYGIDAPWGIGKSSFVNLCCERWNQKYESQIIVHRFEPLRYDDKSDLAEKFVNDLVNTIQKQVFAPTLQSIVSKYSRLIKTKSGASFLGIEFSFEPGQDTIEETLKDLEVVLRSLNKKIVVVVDDLDRLSWTAVKNILFAIKRSFMLPSVSYVICYDTQNIAALDVRTEGAEKVREFLEKFVNVKFSLFLDSTVLANYVSTNFDRAARNNLQIDPRTLDDIKLAMKELVNIYNSEEFPRYQNLLGDIRKMKRLINTILLFEIEKTDFLNSDFNSRDLIHLLLLYINYPAIFRKIFNSEANGRSGHFSLKRNYSDSRTKYINSEEYSTYISQLAEDPRFLLHSLFDSSRLDDDSVAALKDTDWKSLACFNDAGGGRNLERYLNLIVKLSKPGKRESYRFYVRKKDELIEGTSLDEVLATEDFAFSLGDFPRAQLWKIISNSGREFEPPVAAQIINHILDHLPNYSALEGEGIADGSRRMLIYTLLKLLDEAGWGRSGEERRNNTNENLAEIAEWVFGEGQHLECGVLERLGDAGRGPLGLYDLLLFRLYCSADRGGSMFNLQRAISLHGNADAPTSGEVTAIATEGMREVSQKVFRIFKSQYIEQKKCIFDAIDDLSLPDFSGVFSPFIEHQVSSKKIEPTRMEHLIAAQKSTEKSFILYQLGNSAINSGVGCGFYDEAGKEDRKGIAQAINDYLFSVCFVTKDTANGYFRFLDYLLLNLNRNFDNGHRFSFTPSWTEFTKVLQGERLSQYWADHQSKIRVLVEDNPKRSVITSNYVATYGEYLPAVIRVLDRGATT